MESSGEVFNQSEITLLITVNEQTDGLKKYLVKMNEMKNKMKLISYIITFMCFNNVVLKRILYNEVMISASVIHNLIVSNIKLLF